MKKNHLKSLAVLPLVLYNLYGADQVTLSDITVSANKIEENLADIPQTITVIDNVELEEKEIKTVSDVIKEIPNLTSKYLYFETVNFRGLNTSMFTNTNPVVIYIDGIPHSSKFGYNVSFANVDRIEILRGPQGTLYGKDSIGGIINIITKTPTNELAGELSFEYGSNSFVEEKFNLTGPLIEDKLYFGINGLFSDNDGWITNNNHTLNKNANRDRSRNLNANVLYKVNDNFSARLNISEDKDYRYWIEGGIVSTFNGIDSAKRDDFENADYDVDTYTKIKAQSQALNLSYDINNLNFTSLTTHKKVDLDGNYDIDWNNGSLYTGLSKFQFATTDTTSQELRVSNKTHSIKWLSGLYYEDEKFDNDKYGLQRTASYIIDAVSHTDSKTNAAFAQVVFPIIKKVDLTIGGRYQKIKKDYDIDYYMGSTASPYYILKDTHTWNTFLPKAALSYKINDNITTYFTLSKGYLPGGYNYFSYSGNADDNIFNAQTSINYELGIRGDFLDKKLSLSSSVFYMNIDDIHVFNYDQSTGISYVSNAAKAHSKGLELELKYNFLDNWIFESAIGITRAQYDEYESNSEHINNIIENTPKHTVKLGLSYYHPKGYYARVDLENQGDLYFDTANTIKQDSYTLTNVKVGYDMQNWEFYMYIKNIMDKSYLTTAKSDTGGYLLTFGEGRFVGAGIKYRF